MFDTIHNRLMGISRVAVWCGGAALMLAAFMVTLDVISRKIFNYTISGSDEISGYVFAASTTWAYSFCLLSRSNIRIDAFYNLLSLKPRALLDIVGLLCLLYYAIMLTTNGWGMFLENVKYLSTAQTTLATPLWIPQMFWISGLGFFVICLSFLAIYAITSLFRGNWKKINQIIGVKTVQEELVDEIHL